MVLAQTDNEIITMQYRDIKEPSDIEIPIKKKKIDYHEK